MNATEGSYASESALKVIGASMGPPRERDGRLWAVPGMRQGLGELQWGRRVNATEGILGLQGRVRLYALQWGRRVNATEGALQGLE